MPTDRSRAQLVLSAAAVVAVALAAVVLAYLQLGYHADVTASAEYDAPGQNAERVLDRAVHDASADVPEAYDWSERDAAVSGVRADLSPALDSLRTSRVESGTVYRVQYNQSAASAWLAESGNCPDGPNRQFGDCVADRGVVVQERANRTHVLAVAFDVTVVSERADIELTMVVRTTR